MILPLILSIMIGIIHYISDRLNIASSKFKIEVISFVGGVSLVYVFMNLYPEFYEGTRDLNKLVFTSLLLGFFIFYLIDKEIYQKIKHSRASNDIKLAHGYGLIIYYFVVGIVLVKLFDIGLKQGFLFFIPVFTYAGLSTLSGHGIHGMHGPHYRAITHVNFLQVFSVIAGTVIALIFNMSEFWLFYLVGLVAGILTYVVIRDLLPKGKKGSPFFFVIGVVIYLGLIIGLWYV